MTDNVRQAGDAVNGLNAQDMPQFSLPVLPKWSEAIGKAPHRRSAPPGGRQGSASGARNAARERVTAAGHAWAGM